MLRGPLNDPAVKTRFAGHETFPLRRLWLRKAYEAVREDEKSSQNNTFDKDFGIVRFGVGKNMVAAIRHWAQIFRVIEEDGESGTYRVSRLGQLIFDDETGLDPYMESISTIWLLHWFVASDFERATTWFYAFNHLNAQTFDRDSLTESLGLLCKRLERARSSTATLKRDVECFVRSYVAKAGAGAIDDQIETVLGELGLIKEVSSRSFEFRRGAKPTLHDGIFLFALEEFWQNWAPQQSTLSVEAIVYEPGSPGRVFKLDEHAVVDRLVAIDTASKGAYAWSDTAGVRNVARRRDDVDPLDFLPAAFDAETSQEAA
ncbi:DUF4007 family protein [Pontivivens ytuae]|uniref:DUF4007 family protein n=1 Tax=Pontivivens ytuae TaxID=2789856 RepID=A0A7S9LW01_9RHOB|nr:DUF4007 family protein [Pontivivens ytuae]